MPISGSTDWGNWCKIGNSTFYLFKNPRLFFFLLSLSAEYTHLSLFLHLFTVFGRAGIDGNRLLWVLHSPAPSAALHSSAENSVCSCARVGVHGSLCTEPERKIKKNEDTPLAYLWRLCKGCIRICWGIVGGRKKKIYIGSASKTL